MAQKISINKIKELFEQPFADLLWESQRIHRNYFDANYVQVSTLASIKTGACSEDCKYCSQSAHYDTFVEKEKLVSLPSVLAAAQSAKAAGATRFCMGAAWRGLNDKHVHLMTEMVSAVKELGLETCMTLGELSLPQAISLKEAGLDFYNHNIDTSRDHYAKIISTHTYDDRLTTLEHVRKAGLRVCCGGILGMGESREDRIEFLSVLANMDPQPESVPINRLIKIKGTPLEAEQPIDDIEFVRTIAIARIIMPKTVIRLSAGRTDMPESLQALCFLSGANSVFYGEKLLTASNPSASSDAVLFNKLGLNILPSSPLFLEASVEQPLGNLSTDKKIDCTFICS